MQFQAVAVGPFDLAAGVDFLINSQQSGFPWISANIYNSDNKLIFKPFVTLKTGDLNIAVIGLSNPVIRKTKNILVSDGQNELNNLLPKLEKSHDLIILLSTLPGQVLTKFAEQYSDLDIIFSADPRKGNVKEKPVNGTLITQTAKQGKYLGQLLIEWRNGEWGEDKSSKLKTLKADLISVDRQLKTLLKRKQESPGNFEKRKTVIQKNRENFIVEINQAEIDLAKEAPSNRNNTYSTNFFPLRPSIRQDPDILKIINSPAITKHN